MPKPNPGANRVVIFARPEDGEFNPRNPNEYFFVTTGGAAGANELGRLYSLHLNPSDPTKDATLTVVYNADTVIANGGDIAISPGNVSTSGDYLMVQKDSTTESRLVMAAKGRDGSIWRFPLRGRNGVDLSSAGRVVELNPPGRNSSPPDMTVNPGIWETSGIIATDEMFGGRFVALRRAGTFADAGTRCQHRRGRMASNLEAK